MNAILDIVLGTVGETDGRIHQMKHTHRYHHYYKRVKSDYLKQMRTFLVQKVYISLQFTCSRSILRNQKLLALFIIFAQTNTILDGQSPMITHLHANINVTPHVKRMEHIETIIMLYLFYKDS